MQEFELFPKAASSVAGQVDRLHLFVLAVTGTISLGVALAVIFLSVHYRRKRGLPAATHITGSLKLELLWTIVPFLLSMTFFVWGAKLYFEMRRMPAEGLEFFVTGKQWMWKIQHPTGQREINALHVPKGETILLTMASEDVIHDFYVPAFRVKFDVVPGRYSRAWFQATEVGTYHLFCAEYCGTKHSEMIGKVTVMEPLDYQRWLSGQETAVEPAVGGATLFERLRCNTCHAAGKEQRGPVLDGIFGQEGRMADGSTVLRDADYLRQSILEPNARVLQGYQPLMPTYRGQVSEADLFQLVAYLESLGLESPGAETEPEEAR